MKKRYKITKHQKGEMIYYTVHKQLRIFFFFRIWVKCEYEYIGFGEKTSLYMFPSLEAAQSYIDREHKILVMKRKGLYNYKEIIEEIDI